MGRRGPKPLPANVHRLRGNASHLAKDRLAGGVEPEIEIPDCPRHLLKEARKFWRRITPELEHLGLVSNIDQAALALACQEWGWLVWHETKLQEDIAHYAAVRLAFEVAEDAKQQAALAAGQVYVKDRYTGADGFQVPTPNGNLTYSPHWVGRNKHALLLDKFLASFGMSPSSRGRVTPSSRQYELPGVPAKEGFSAL